MPRIRSIKPDLWQSPEVMNISHSARLLFIGLITQADDDGKGSADPRKLRAAIFGGDDITVAQVGEWLAEIAGQRLAILYTVDGFGDLFLLPSWNDHQYVQKRQASRYPDPVDNLLPERYRNRTGTVPWDRKDGRIGKGSDARAKTGPALGLKAGPSGARPETEAEARRQAFEDNQRTVARALRLPA